MILLILLTMLIGDVAWTLAARRAFAGGGRTRYLRWAAFFFVGVMVAALLAMLLGRMVGVRPDAMMPRALLVSVYVWHFLGLGIGLIVALIYGSGLIIARLRKRATADAPAPVDAPHLSRRDFLARAAALAPVAVTLGASATTAIELNRFRVREIDVPIRGLPSGIDGLTIAHLSDVHLGRFTTAATFRSIVETTNSLDCDLVLQTGDLINHDQRDLAAAAELTHALRARHGQWLCEGNHDLIEGRDAFYRIARAARLPLLVDEVGSVTINGIHLNLLGLPWARIRRGDGAGLEEALRSSVTSLASRASPGAFPILLAHHPHAFDAATMSGIPLTLSGHTHGGQLQLSKHLGFGPLMYRYWSGLYERDGRACVVSNGAGNWFPLRINAPAEILRLTLKRA